MILFNTSFYYHQRYSFTTCSYLPWIYHKQWLALKAIYLSHHHIGYLRKMLRETRISSLKTENIGFEYIYPNIFLHKGICLWNSLYSTWSRFYLTSEGRHNKSKKDYLELSVALKWEQGVTTTPLKMWYNPNKPNN